MEIPELEVPAEAPLTVDIRDGYQPPWLEGTSLSWVGRDVWSEPADTLRVDAQDGEGTPVMVPIEPDTTCLTHPEDGLPDGDYVLYAFTELDPASGRGQ